MGVPQPYSLNRQTRTSFICVCADKYGFIIIIIIVYHVTIYLTEDAHILSVFLPWTYPTHTWQSRPTIQPTSQPTNCDTPKTPQPWTHFKRIFSTGATYIWSWIFNHPCKKKFTLLGLFFKTRQCTRVHCLGVPKCAKLEERYVFGHIDKFCKGHDTQIKKNACKNAYLGSIFINEKYMFRVCFESPFTRMISSLKHKCPPPRIFRLFTFMDLLRNRGRPRLEVCPRL